MDHPVAVFAHNEAANIRACLESLSPAAGEAPAAIYVLANGCTDATESIVGDYARAHPNVRLCSLALGDKANAWNVYVHELAPGAPAHFFIDGDVQAVAGSLAALGRALEEHAHAHAASALPVSGRTVAPARAEMMRRHELAGNLYALRGSFVADIRRRSIRIPAGFIGEDSYVGALAKWNLDPRTKWDDARVVPCADAGFRFRSLSPWRTGDIRTYWRRRIRYGIRRWQLRMLQRHVYAGQPFETVPADAAELCRLYLGDCRLSWRGGETLFDWLALRRLRRQHGSARR